ncbi:hypothetical protein J2X97_000338 [Epilithonimonas hungarica]|uniref:hypothetical protein n=1 Tax=Epilithonimonas hungarica TaxID=454006 RepID=UPI00278029A4|nr:hypothetical protein [Epilithonimonas hungarica]MDP9954701.1 hypothetical protein [Epilithonimonas hungarica]
MQRFWYHSPVRFYQTQEELSDMTNPQNTQFFGVKDSYPLELGVFHRFLIPNYQNDVDTTELELFLVNSKDNYIPCEFGFSNGKIFRVTFISSDQLNGQFQIRKKTGETIFYSNCVKFIDSTDSKGRKYIRIATKHLYNKNLFAYGESNFEWMVTNLPAYCLGQFSVDSEVSNIRTGGHNSPTPKDTYIDEVVSYEFIGKGDSNILSFIQTHISNKEFYIDGTKRTATEKVDADEFAMIGKMKFANQKDKDGLNIILNEDEIFDDAVKYVLANEQKTIAYIDNTNALIETK